MSDPIVFVRYRYRLLGGHAHVAVFAGRDRDHLAKAGNLVFRLEEWAALVAVMDCDQNGVYDIVEDKPVEIKQLPKLAPGFAWSEPDDDGYTSLRYNGHECHRSQVMVENEAEMHRVMRQHGAEPDAT